MLLGLSKHLNLLQGRKLVPFGCLRVTKRSSDVLRVHVDIRCLTLKSLDSQLLPCLFRLHSHGLLTMLRIFVGKGKSPSTILPRTSNQSLEVVDRLGGDFFLVLLPSNQTCLLRRHIFRRKLSSIVCDQQLQTSNLSAEFRLRDIILLSYNFGRFALPHERAKRDLACAEMHQRVSIP